MELVRSRRAFSLIEAMVVVVIVGVLALLGTIAYRRWVHNAYLTEAQEMVANIRAAEESFRAENGGYLAVSGGLGPGNDYPAATPGKFKTSWGAASPWLSLNVQPSGPLAFGYSLMADNKNPPGFGAIKVAGQTLVGADTMAAPWYMIEADGDMDGNGVFTKVYGMSATNRVFIDNEGE
jgi:prepilin-type N-terminal cleavage/methylation domain-containing protein